MSNREKLLINIENIIALVDEDREYTTVNFILSKYGVSNIDEASESELQNIFNELFTLITM